MVKIVQHSWLGGQLDAEMLGRQDKDKYHIGATTLKNFVPIRRGAIRKRPGTDFVVNLDEQIGGSEFRLVPFSYLSYFGYAILFVNEDAFAVNSNGDILDITGDIPYRAEDLDELHYVQCGDVLYLAHHLYKPACIRHIDSTTFVYEEVRTQPVREGVPIITDATMTRLVVSTDYRSGIRKEEYRVSAVRNGIETVSSPVYVHDNATAETTASGVKTSDTHTTSYYLPWTESQVISLTIDKNNGDLGDPDEMRIYKGTGSSFGLIGILKSENTYVGSVANETKRTLYSASSTNTLYNVNDIRDFGVDYGSWYAAASGGIEINFRTNASFSELSFGLGGIYTFYNKNDSIYHYDSYYFGTLSGYLLAPTPHIEVCYKTDDEAAEWTLLKRSQLVLGRSEPSSAVIHGNATSLALAKEAVRKWAEGSTFSSVTKHFTMPLDNTVTGVRKLRIRAVYNSGTEQSPVWTEITGSFAVNVMTREVTRNDAPFLINNVRARIVDAIPGEFVDDGIVPDSSVSPSGEDSVMDEDGDYPSTVAVYQQRLVWASSDNDPARIWMSQIGDFGVYTPHEIQTADDAIDFILPITRFAKVNHIIEMRALMAFSEACEWVVSSNSAATGISAETIDARAHSYIGSDGRLPPIVCNNAIVFAERTGESVRRYGYQLEDDGYGGRDISIFSSSIFNEKRIVDWTYQQFPQSTIWAVLSDGTMASLIFMDDHEQKICAWATHTVGGGRFVEAIACTHALSGNDNANANTGEVLMIVRRRETSGETVTDHWDLEVMRPFPKQTRDEIANMVTMDSVRALAEGASIPSGMVAVDKSTGARVTTVGANGAWAGYVYEAEMTNMPPAISDQDIGAGQFDVKNVQQVAFRLVNTVGGNVRPYGSVASQASSILSVTPTVANGELWTPQRDVRCPLYGSNNRDGRVTVTQNLEWPMMITLMESDLAVEVEGQK